jgi:hypothetical protein
MPRKAAALLTLALVSLAFAPTAHADKYDLRLSRLYGFDDNAGKWAGRYNNHLGRRINSSIAFEKLMGDMGAALAPRFLGPGATTGALGFRIGFNYSITNIPEDDSAWQSVLTPWGDVPWAYDSDPNPGNVTGADSYLQTIQFHVRKGLPFSAEVGGTITKLLQSNLWGVGLELKWAALEGFRFAPEIAFRSAISTFQGSKDYALLVASADAIISKMIGIAGLFKLGPYLGYNFLYTHGSSNVIALPKSGNSVDQQVFPSANDFRHYIAFGFQVVATVVNTGFEVAISPADVEMHSFSWRIGVDF